MLSLKRWLKILYDDATWIIKSSIKNDFDYILKVNTNFVSFKVLWWTHIKSLLSLLLFTFHRKNWLCFNRFQWKFILLLFLFDFFNLTFLNYWWSRFCWFHSFVCCFYNLNRLWYLNLVHWTLNSRLLL